MLTLAEIKLPLQQRHSQLLKLLMALGSLPPGVSVKDIKARALTAGFRVPAAWNCSDILRRSKGSAIRTPLGWEISDAGWSALAAIGLSPAPGKPAVQTLKLAAVQVHDLSLRAYLDEAVGCAEAGFKNASIVLSWMAAIFVLQQHVVSKHLSDFNIAAKTLNPKWKPATNTEQIGTMRERDFLDRLEGLGVITNSVKKALIECLDRRNSCGHPTTVELSSATVEHHFELIMKNVVKPFAV